MTSQNQAEGDISNALFEEIADLCNWLDLHALPLWLNVGFDRDLGLFHERLDMNGKPIADIPRRLLVQCRQIGIYAYATLRGRIDARDILKAVYERIRALYHIHEFPGQWRYSIDPDGTSTDTRVDSYSLSFVIFALAWLYRLDPNDRYLEDADNILALLEGPLATHCGGIAIELGRDDEILLQNPNMHFFEACLTLYEAAGRKKDFDRAQSLARLFSEKLFDDKFSAIPEHHLAGWVVDNPATNWYEPGHHFEWSWLLRQFERLGGEDYSSLIERLSQRTLSEGIDQSSIVIEQVGLLNTFKKSSSRNWGVCEYLKFCAAEYQEANWRADDQAAAIWRSKTLSGMRALKKAFLSTQVKGLWHDRMSGEGRPLTDYAPASSFYHIGFAIAEVERVFTRVVPKKLNHIPEPKSALFLDRDGVINVDIAYAHRPEQIEFIPSIFDLVRRANEEGQRVIVVTNQSGIARSYYNESDVINLHNWMAEKFEEQDAKIDAFYHCAYLSDAKAAAYRREEHFDRKPFPGMLKRAALEWNIALNISTLVGDKLSDIAAAKAVGMQSSLVKTNSANIINIHSNRT